MVVCELDHNVSGEVLGWKLPPWQALLLHRVLPSCGGFIIYVTVVCFDVALIIEHYNNGDNGIGAFCILLMLLPSVVSLVFTLSFPPPALRTDLTAFSVSLEKNDVRWIVMQFVNCVFFPIATIGRYCHQIFWWVEAICAARVDDSTRTKEAVSRARAHSPVELYLFLQAFLHSAPHVVLNVLDLISRQSNPTFDKVSVQSVSIIASILRMASTATVYRRFQREKICGRKYPWQIEIGSEVPENEEKSPPEENIYETIGNRESLADSRNDKNSDMIQFSPQSKNISPWFEDHLDSDSGTSLDYLPPVNANQSERSVSSDEAYVKPITSVSIIEKVAPRRRDTQYTIENVNITPPPAVPAPRPASLATWAEKFVENAEAIPLMLSAPTRRMHIDEIIPEEPDIPRAVPRSFVRGLEPQDFTASLTQFLGWYAFFIARLLSITAFINCVPVAAIIVLFSHYQIILLLLIIPQAPTVRRGFYIFLAFIYLFCLMEFKIRFRHVRVWHVFWMIVCTIETIIFTGIWYNLSNNLGDWWMSFITQVILYSMLLSYMCLLVYFVLLKPRETIVYINNRNNDLQH